MKLSEKIGEIFNKACDVIHSQLKARELSLNLLAQEREEQLRNKQLEEFKLSMKAYYRDFGNSVLEWLQSNADTSKLKRPLLIEEIMLPQDEKRVTLERRGYVFRYESNRLLFDKYTESFQKPLPYITTKRIREMLLETLPIFAESRGYAFQDISVSDIEGRKILIEIFGVRKVDV